MDKRKRMRSVRHIDLIREARAGLIPASDFVAEERRAREKFVSRVVHTAKTHLGTVTQVSDEQAIASILADLLHYCDLKNLVFRKLHMTAYALYLEDKADESA